MKDIVYPLGHGESQLICHRGDLLDDFEGSISFGPEFCLLMADFEVGYF
jgi:hypothetical protein